MNAPRRQLFTLVLCLGSIFAGLGFGAAGAGAAEKPSFSTNPPLSPAFGFNRSDYAIRCGPGSTKVELHAPAGWTGWIGKSNPQTGSRSFDLSVKPNRAFAVRFRQAHKPPKVFHVRCLPTDFPDYSFAGHWTGGPRLVVAQMPGRYAVAFDRAGAPVWWFKAPEGSPNDAQLLADATLAYAPVEGVTFRRFQIRNLEGKAIRTVSAANGAATDIHDLDLLANGNYLIGSHRRISGIDASPFGGATDSTIDTAQLQELTPAGRLVWKWNAYPRIGLRETGRWWKTIGGWGSPYDVNHWNSIDRQGRRILISFRHLDAVYMIDRRTGRIRWKLGGVKTAKSLRLRGDRFGSYPFGGQHDARFVPGGITVFDNATNLKRKQPRALRFRIQARRRQATLVDELRDPEVPASVGMGSARLTSAGWFVGWGAINLPGIAGGYDQAGEPLFRLSTPDGFGYRLNPVTSKKPSLDRLRRAMDRIAAQGR